MRDTSTRCRAAPRCFWTTRRLAHIPPRSNPQLSCCTRCACPSPCQFTRAPQSPDFALKCGVSPAIPAVVVESGIVNPVLNDQGRLRGRFAGQLISSFVGSAMPIARHGNIDVNSIRFTQANESNCCPNKLLQNDRTRIGRRRLFPAAACR
jgi:hypothetical protein